MNIEVLQKKQGLWSRGFLDLLKEDSIASFTLIGVLCNTLPPLWHPCHWLSEWTAQEVLGPPIFPGCICACAPEAGVYVPVLLFLRSLLFLLPYTFCLNCSLFNSPLIPKTGSEHLSSSHLVHSFLVCCPTSSQAPSMMATVRKACRCAVEQQSLRAADVSHSHGLPTSVPSYRNK